MFEQAASVPTSGLIALQNLRGLSQWQPGKTVLINGAGGGVGALALQMMKAHGARVTAVDSTGKLDMLRSLGADEVVDYTREDFTQRGVRYDLIFDVPGNRPFSAFRRALEPDGDTYPSVMRVSGRQAAGSSGSSRTSSSSSPSRVS